MPRGDRPELRIPQIGHSKQAIDEGDLVAYKFGRVIRLQQPDLERFIEASRIEPGSLEHLYPEVKGSVRGARRSEGGRAS